MENVPYDLRDSNSLYQPIVYEHHSNEISFREGLCEVIRQTVGCKATKSERLSCLALSG